MNFDNLTEGQQKKLVSDMAQRSAAIEEALRDASAKIIAIMARTYSHSPDPKVKLGAATALNLFANLTHQLGVIPRDVVQMALDRAIVDDEAPVEQAMLRETSKKMAKKLKAVMSGQPVSDDDGIFLGYCVDEEEGLG